MKQRNDKGWLKRQLDNAKRTVDSLPDWMKPLTITKRNNMPIPKYYCVRCEWRFSTAFIVPRCPVCMEYDAVQKYKEEESNGSNLLPKS